MAKKTPSKKKTAQAARKPQPPAVRERPMRQFRVRLKDNKEEILDGHYLYPEDGSLGLYIQDPADETGFSDTLIWISAPGEWRGASEVVPETPSDEPAEAPEGDEAD